MRSARRRGAGFTLIELMISLVIASLLVLFMLDVFQRLAREFRRHQQVAGTQQVLSAVRNALEYDARHAGLGLAQGFTLASDGGAARYAPVQIQNQSVGPDQVAFFYGDPGVQAVVLATPPPTRTTITVDDATGFAAGDLVVLSTVDTTSTPNPIAADEAPIATFTACVVELQAVAGDDLTLSTAAPWGMPDNAHCIPPVAGQTMVYRFVAHAWRIDPTRPALAVLQLERSGALTGTVTWEDQAHGISDLQVASYVYDDDGVDTGDPDADGARDWYSSDSQTALTTEVPVATQLPSVLAVSLSVVARAQVSADSITSAQTPSLVDPANVTNNPVGDRAAVVLPSTLPDLAGNHVYRHQTFEVDLRNVGVGR